jgi:DNA-binding transcriptional LysR family regulator
VLDLRRLRLLRELKRRGMITAVAEALSYSPSAASQQLSTLEKETRARLLEPAGRGVRLTLQAECSSSTPSDCSRRWSAPRRRSPSRSTPRPEPCASRPFLTAVLALVPQTLLHLADEHPGLRVEVAEAEPEGALPELLAGQFDLVLREEYPDRPLPGPRETERRDLCKDDLRLALPTA